MAKRKRNKKPQTIEAQILDPKIDWSEIPKTRAIAERMVEMLNQNVDWKTLWDFIEKAHDLNLAEMQLKIYEQSQLFSHPDPAIRMEAKEWVLDLQNMVNAGIAIKMKVYDTMGIGEAKETQIANGVQTRKALPSAEDWEKKFAENLKPKGELFEAPKVSGVN